MREMCAFERFLHLKSDLQWKCYDIIVTTYEVLAFKSNGADLLEDVKEI